MIRFLNGIELSLDKTLKRSMHLDRASQFSDRLRWDVSVNSDGEERDEYDKLNPLYVISVNCRGEHEGSLRLLPTTGRTMVNDHFLDLTDGVRIVSPHIWECTRFCISPSANRRTAPKLLAAGAFLMKHCSVDHFVGVFDGKMEKIYKAIGASPTIVGRKNLDSQCLSIGLWQFDEDSYQKILKKAQLSESLLNSYFCPNTTYVNPRIRDEVYFSDTAIIDKTQARELVF